MNFITLKEKEVATTQRNGQIFSPGKRFGSYCYKILKAFHPICNHGNENKQE